MKTTLIQIREKSPGDDRWERLLDNLGKTHTFYEPLRITTILDSNGLDDALWCLRAVNGCNREIRLYAVWCARQVQHLMTDKRSLDALDVAERFANGFVSDDEKRSAGGAAWAVERSMAREAVRDVPGYAALNAARAARYAAGGEGWGSLGAAGAKKALSSTAWAEACAAAGVASRAEAWAAAGVASWSVAGAASWEALELTLNAAGTARKVAREIALNAARNAERDASWKALDATWVALNASWAARDMAWAAQDVAAAEAWDAAHEVARVAQEKRLREVCAEIDVAVQVVGVKT